MPDTAVKVSWNRVPVVSLVSLFARPLCVNARSLLVPTSFRLHLLDSDTRLMNRNDARHKFDERSFVFWSNRVIRETSVLVRLMNCSCIIIRR